MPHLHSLICFEGRDHNIRFLLLSFAIYAAFILNSLLFSAVIALFVLINFALLIVMAATANRRVRDAKIPPIWQLMPVSIFAFIAFLPLFYPQDHAYFALLLGIPATLLMTIKPSAETPHYVWGYQGPVCFESTNQNTQANTQYANRIEPTFISGQNEHYGQQQRSDHQQSATISNPSAGPINDWYEPIRLFMLKHQTTTLACSAIWVIIAITGLTYPLLLSNTIQSAEQPVEPQQQLEKPQFDAQVRQYAFEMPTNDYSLMLNEHDGLIVHWPSYDQNNPQLWSITSAKGEQSCEQLEFNDKQKVRTLLVTIEDDGDYYASFSPLDTEKLVTGIADKSKFTLCGYDFSLKGTRAAIMQSEIYSQFLR